MGHVYPWTQKKQNTDNFHNLVIVESGSNPKQGKLNTNLFIVRHGFEHEREIGYLLITFVNLAVQYYWDKLDVRQMLCNAMVFVKLVLASLSGR